MRSLALALSAAVALLLSAPSAGAAEQQSTRHPAPGAAAADVCTPVHARGNGVDNGDGTTTATIRVQRVRIGTTSAAFTVTGVVGTVASFEGAIDFTADGGLGTLHAPVTGTLDLATGAFRSTSDSVTGGGGLTGVTGSLTFKGRENLTTLRFTERITGRLCAPA